MSHRHPYLFDAATEHCEELIDTLHDPFADLLIENIRNPNTPLPEQRGDFGMPPSCSPSERRGPRRIVVEIRFGAGLRPFLRVRRIRIAFNISMAALILVTAWWMAEPLLQR